MRGNESEPLLLFYLFIYGTPIALFLLRAWYLRRIRDEITRGVDLPGLAGALNGEMARDPSFNGPFVRFTAEGIRGYLHQRMLNSTQSVVITTLEGKAGFPGFLQATTIGGIRHPMKSTRIQTIQTAAGFEVVTTNLKWAHGILGEGLHDILVQLRGSTKKGTRIQLGGDRFLIEVEERIGPSQAARLRSLVGRLSALSRRAGVVDGITFEGDITLVEQSRCPVCSQACSDPGVRCETCKAAHHADCWSYWGRCAIFGCSGRRAT